MCKLERKRYVLWKVNSQNNSCENTFYWFSHFYCENKKDNLTAVWRQKNRRALLDYQHIDARFQRRCTSFLWILVNLKISKWICSPENNRLWEYRGKWSRVSGGMWGGVTRWNTVRMSKSLPDSSNPTAYEVLPPAINCLMNMHKESNEIGQNNAS